MSWHHKGVEILLSDSGMFTASVGRGGDEEISLKADTLVDIKKKIEGLLSGKLKVKDLDLPCIKYSEEEGVVEITLLGISGRDSAFRTRPPTKYDYHHHPEVYPRHPYIELLLTQLEMVDKERAKLLAALKPLELKHGYGRKDLGGLQPAYDEIQEAYEAILRKVGK